MNVRNIIMAIAGILCVSLPVRGGAQEADSLPAPDSADFITVSFVTSAPSGRAIYSTLGHATLRMECPAYELDYCFSPEIAQPLSEAFSFFAGKARAGLIMARTSDYLEACRAEGRTVTAYPLNLTPDEKRELWRLLDTKVAEGLYMEYDYLNRGCGIEAMSFVDMAIGRGRIGYGDVPAWLSGSRREISFHDLEAFPWMRLFIMLMLGDEADEEVPLEKKLMIPSDIAAALADAEIVDTAGVRRPMLSGEPVVLYESGASCAPFPFPDPLWVFGAVLLWTVVLTWVQCRRPDAWRSGGRVTDGVLFVVQAVAGLFMAYLWWCSDLVATGWNKYDVPFNVLPLLVYVAGRVRPFPAAVWQKVYLVYGGVLAAFIVACVWLPCPDYPLWCLFGAMAVRCFYQACMNRRIRRNNKVKS